MGLKDYVAGGGSNFKRINVRSSWDGRRWKGVCYLGFGGDRSHDVTGVVGGPEVEWLCLIYAARVPSRFSRSRFS